MLPVKHIRNFCIVLLCVLWVTTSSFAQPDLVPEISAVELNSNLTQAAISTIHLAPNWGIVLQTKKGVFVSTLDSEELLKGSDSLAQQGQIFVAASHQTVAIATETGFVTIYKKQGKSIEIETLGFKESIQNIALFENTLWVILKANKLLQIDVVKHTTVSTSLPFESNGLMAIDAAGIILASNTQLWFSLKNRLEFKEIKLVENSTQKPIFTTLTASSTGDFYAGTYERGIFRTRGKSAYQLSSTEKFSNINQLITTANHLYFIDENAHLIRYDGFLKTCSILSSHYKKFPAANGLLALEHEKVLIATTFGLWQIEGEILQLNIQLNQPTAATFLNATTLAFADKNGVTLQSISSNSKIVLSQFKGGIVTSLFAVNNSDTLWVGTFDFGLFAINSKGETIAHFTEKNGLPNASVLSINMADNTLWLATLSGLCRYDFATKTFSVLPPDADAQYVYSVFKDSKNRIWLGTDGSGLLEVTTAGETVQIQRLRSVTVYSISEDKHGHVWFSSNKKGLFEYELDRPIFYPVNQQNGIRSLSVASICATAGGNMLVFNDRGVDFALVDERKAFPINTSLPLATPSEIIRNSFVDDLKNVWFYTEENLFRIEKTIDHEFENTPLITTSFYVNDIEKSVHALQNLAYDENNITLETGFNWQEKNKQLRLMYRILEIDSIWKTSETNKLAFNQLNYGNYTLQVAYGRNGYVFPASIQTTAILIEKPWWMKAYVIVAEILLGLVLLFGIITWRANSLATTERLYRSKAEAELAAIKNQVNPHFLFNAFNSLLELIETSTPKATTYLEKLSDFYRAILQTTTANLIPLKEEIVMLENYVYLQQERFGLGFKIINTIDPTYHPYQLPPLSLQRLIENALKHNAILVSNPLTIELYIENEWLIVKNNKIAKATQKQISTGIGLKSINDQLEITQQKQLKIEESSAFFIVKIPLVQQA